MLYTPPYQETGLWWAAQGDDSTSLTEFTVSDESGLMQEMESTPHGEAGLTDTTGSVESTVLDKAGCVCWMALCEAC